MSVLNVSAFLKELGNDQGGVSKPVLVLASDGIKYILKNQNTYDPGSSSWMNYDCMFLQEMLVEKIGLYIDAPIPNTAIIDVEKIHLDNAPSLPFTHRYKPGYHFSSEFLPDVENNLRIGYQQLMQIGKPYTKTNWNNYFKKITNPKDVAKIIALDLLVGNFDRFGNDGNLMVAVEEGKRKIFAIDHGHAFYGAVWGNNKINFLNSAKNDMVFMNQYLQSFMSYSGRPLSGLGHMFRAIEYHVDINNIDVHDFVDVIYQIESITIDLLDQWFNEIPKQWYVDRPLQIAFYKKFILTNKNNIRHLINLMIRYGAFSNTNGGQLVWKDLQTGTQ